MNGGPVQVEVLIRGACPTQAFKVGNPWQISATAGDQLLFAMLNCLVVEVSTPLKNDGVNVNWDDDIPNIEK